VSQPAAPDIRVLTDPVRAAAELLAETAAAAGAVALSGGSTPGPAYRLARTLCPNWGKTEVWFGDERAVRMDDPLSNYRLVETSLLSQLETRPAAVHRIRGELGAAHAADLYETEIGGARIALALNGIGPDGHTASLFPNSAALAERERRVVAAPPQLDPYVDRVTLTRPCFAQVDLLVYLVVGAKKATAVRSSFAEEPNADTPASLVRGQQTLALLDTAAASELP
jgi:6-phosphogluconolactonase